MRALLGVLLAVAVAGCAGTRGGPQALTPRPLVPFDGERWVGRGVAYGPYRDGQAPGAAAPTRAQLREDLLLLKGRFELLRLYGSTGPTPELLALIREERLPFQVLLGAWIEREEDAAAREANRVQVETALRLAAEYPELVLGVVVGNETQVSWSAHRMDPEVIVRWLRVARAGTAKPVATADDFAYWVLPESARVARECDFLVMHAHPLWNGKQLAEALAFTQQKYAEVVRRHAGRPVVLGESGWATRSAREGEQARLIKGTPGEAQQRRFFFEYSAWTQRERIVSTWFSAFDESWKGGPNPDEVEKHWGLFNADRTPKQAAAGTHPAATP